MKNLKLRKSINAIGFIGTAICTASLPLIVWGKSMDHLYMATAGLTIGLLTMVVFMNLDKAYNQTFTK